MCTEYLQMHYVHVLAICITLVQCNVCGEKCTYKISTTPKSLTTQPWPGSEAWNSYDVSYTATVINLSNFNFSCSSIQDQCRFWIYLKSLKTIFA